VVAGASAPAQQQAPAPAAAPAVSVGEPQAGPREREGERLDPVTSLGPVLVETMAEVMERERKSPSPTENRKQRGDDQGVWAVPSRRSSFHAHSGEHYLINKWGDTRMAVDFPRPVAFEGAWMSGHSDPKLWADGLRFLGYLDGEAVAASPWFDHLQAEPAWVAADFERVDRVEIEARPVYRGGGWYGLDDLTYVELDAQGDSGAARVVLDFDDLPFNTRVTGSGYGGLTWPQGQGDFEQQVSVVPPPQVPPGLGTEQRPPSEAIQGLSGGGGGTPPILVDSFQGPRLGDAGAGWLPPDTCGAVGPDHFVAVVNQNLSVYEKDSGQRVVNTGLSNFWNTGSSAGDPRAVYDPHHGRFFVVACDFSTRLWFAMSYTSDPTGAWFKTSIVLSQGADAGHWPDYPTLGVDADAVYSASYMVGSGSPMSLFVIDKAPLVSPLPSMGTVTAFRSLPWEGAIQPCVTHGDPGRGYCVSRSSSTTLRLRYVQGPMSSPSLVEAGFASVPWHQSPPDAPALGSVAPLDALDWRPMNAVYRNGSVWTAHGVEAGGRAACRWYEIDAASATTLQTGTVTNAVMSYMDPSISVNADNSVVVAFSGSNAETYGSSYFAGRVASDPPGQLSKPELLRAGTAPYNTVDASGVNRWGDYSLTSVDPEDDLTIWTIQEHTRSQDSWGTRIGRLKFPEVCPEPTVYCVGVANSVGVGARISSDGSSSIAANDLVLEVDGLPPSVPGIFYYGPNQTQLPFGEGWRCVSGSVTRLSPTWSDQLGHLNRALDLASPPFSSGFGQVVAGESENFQFWYRDTMGGPSGFNLSDALEVEFCP